MRGNRALLALAVGFFISVPASADDKTADDIAANIKNLGHVRFSVRDQAARDLVRAGEPALNAVKAAVASTDEEVRRRAEVIVRAIEARLQNDALLRAPMLRLNSAKKPLDEALADLNKQAGLPFVLDAAVTDRKRPVTLDTGDVPYWEAIEKFLAAAGLGENHAAAAIGDDQAQLQDQKIRQLRGMRYSGRGSSMPTPDANIRLVDSRSITSAATGTLIRVKALPKDFPGNVATKGSNEFTLILDVTPAPSLAWQGLVNVDVRRAVDDRGVSHAQSHLGRTGVTNTVISEDFGWAVQIQGGPQGQVMIWDADGIPGGGQNAVNSRHIPVTLLAKHSSSKTLKQLEGVITAQVLTAPQALLTVDNLLTAPTKGAVRDGDYQLQIVERKEEKGGYVQLRFKLVSPVRNDVIDVPVNINGRMRPFIRVDTGYIGNGQPNLTFTGPDGKAITNHSLTMLEQSFNGQTQSFEYLLVLPARDKKTSAGPVKMALIGRKSVCVEVPFVLKDVPLP